jgi:hypothetical protein
MSTIANPELPLFSLFASAFRAATFVRAKLPEAFQQLLLHALAPAA